MTLWRKARTEVAGAWRSVRYDLARPEPDADRPDVTSTGFHTFGGVDRDAGLRTSSGEELALRPRRVAAVSVFGVLVIAGAAGSYFAVVNGIGALFGDKPVGAEPYPLAAEGPRGTQGDRAHSGLGRGPAAAGARVPVAAPPAATTAAPTADSTVEPAPTTVRVLPPTVPPIAPVPPDIIVPRPRQTTVAGEPATPPTDCCPNPPVPTPTAPVVVPDSPSATPSPTASSPDGSASPEPSGSTGSAAPSESVHTPEPDEDEGHRHRSRRY